MNASRELADKAASLPSGETTMGKDLFFFLRIFLGDLHKYMVGILH